MQKIVSSGSPVIYAALILAAVFITDLFTPLGIATGVMYLFCFILVCGQSKSIISAFAIITSALTLGKLLVFMPLAPAPMAIANRVITILVIVIVALLALRHRSLIDKVNAERNIYIGELEEMLSMTSHKVRKPLVTCLGLMELVDSDKTMTAEELKKVVQHLKSSALELDAFTKDLTNFVHGIRNRGETA